MSGWGSLDELFRGILEHTQQTSCDTECNALKGEEVTFNFFSQLLKCSAAVDWS